MERRLIDDSPVIEQIGCDIAAIDSVDGKPGIVPLIIRDYLQGFIDLLKQQPTVDAVQVVRCKDCKRWNRFTRVTFKDERKGLCEYRDHIMSTREDFYCADGERKEQNDEID